MEFKTMAPRLMLLLCLAGTLMAAGGGLGDTEGKVKQLKESEGLDKIGEPLQGDQPYSGYNDHDDEVDVDSGVAAIDCISHYCSGVLNRTACGCDGDCRLHGDCCGDADPIPFPEKYRTFVDNFSCVKIETSMSDDMEISVVTKCPPDYPDTDIRRSCENVILDDVSDVLAETPVTEPTKSIVFRNAFCATCHGFTSFSKYYFWKAELDCVAKIQEVEEPTNKDITLSNDEVPPLRSDFGFSGSGDDEDADLNIRVKRAKSEITDSYLLNTSPQQMVADSTCRKYFQAPDRRRRPRTCKTGINTCDRAWKDRIVESLCTKMTGYVYSPDGKRYKNKYCAKCRHETTILCDYSKKGLRENTRIHTYQNGYKYVEYRILLDFAKGKGEVVDQSMNFRDLEQRSCSSDKVFHPVLQRCVRLICQKSYHMEGDQCVKSEALTDIDSCRRTEIPAGQYEIYANSTAFLKSRKKSITPDSYTLRDKKLEVCATKMGMYGNGLFGFKLHMKWWTHIGDGILEWAACLGGSIMSICVLGISIGVHLTLPELRNTHGQCLISLSFFILLAQTCMVAGIYLEWCHYACLVLGVIQHYSILCAFFWVHSMAIDVYRSYARPMSAKNNTNTFAFINYSFYSYIMPGIVIAFAVVADQLQIMVLPRPLYGEGYCWLNSWESMFYLFAAPITVVQMLTYLFLLLAFCNIRNAIRAAKDIELRTSATKPKRLVFYTKLALLLGGCWGCGCAASLLNMPILWYPFAGLNLLVGVFICLAFSASGKVGLLMRRKWGEDNSIDVRRASPKRLKIHSTV